MLETVFFITTSFSGARLHNCIMYDKIQLLISKIILYYIKTPNTIVISIWPRHRAYIAPYFVMGDVSPSRGLSVARERKFEG